MSPAAPAEVSAAFAAMPEPARARALHLRDMVFACADEAGLAAPRECLKWGRPAYVPGKGGTTIRIASERGTPGCRMLVHCQKTLVEDWRARFDGRLEFQGNRAVVIAPDTPPDHAALRQCILDALTYHSRKP